MKRERSHMTEIPWERTVNDVPAMLRESSDHYFIPVLALMGVAEAKMTDLALISADFNGEPILFEYRVGVYLTKGSNAEFFGVYIPDEEEDVEIQEEEQRRRPMLCLRHAHWDQKRDAKQFREATSMKGYVQH